MKHSYVGLNIPLTPEMLLKKVQIAPEHPVQPPTRMRPEIENLDLCGLLFFWLFEQVSWPTFLANEF